MPKSDQPDVLTQGRVLAEAYEHDGLIAMIDAGDARAAQLAIVMDQFGGDYETPSVRDWAFVSASNREKHSFWVDTADSKDEALREIGAVEGDWSAQGIVDLRNGEASAVELVGVATIPMKIGN